MKLLIVTAVDQFQQEVLALFKKSNIASFSGAEIAGYKQANSFLMNAAWFPSVSAGADSSMFFSFTEEKYINQFFEEVKAFNKNLETNNPIKAVVVNVEKFI